MAPTICVPMHKGLLGRGTGFLIKAGGKERGAASPTPRCLEQSRGSSAVSYNFGLGGTACCLLPGSPIPRIRKVTQEQPELEVPGEEGGIPSPCVGFERTTTIFLQSGLKSKSHRHFHWC